jgi:acyl-CoA synthetase (AMP-forming)/AMP-acid ligase II
MLGKSLTRKAQATPNKPALIAGSREVSYREFDARTQALARGLRRIGLRPGDRVAIHLPNSIETAMIYLACFKAGLIAVSCKTGLKPDELGFVLEHSQARAYVAHSTLYDRFSAVRSKLPAIERIVLVDQESSQNEAVHFDELPARHSEMPLPQVAPDAEAVILYTSGTTAQPKGVLHTHQSLWHCARLHAEAFELRSDERELLMCPMMHMSGLLQLLTTVFNGGTAIIVPPLNPAAALDAIEQERCTHMLGLPVAYHFMVREQERSPRRVDTIRSALCGGDSVPVALIQAFQSAFGVPILEGHGMSECAPNIVNPLVGLRPGSMGRPLPGVEARVDAAPGEAGELLLRTPGMFARYWRDEEETRLAFQDGFLRTGDLARIDDDGFFWFAARSKEIIVRGAANISPQEVEDVICRHPAVAQAGVVGVPDDTWGESVRAFVVLKTGAAATADDLRTFLLERLGDWKVPDSIYFERELPLGPTGKVNRRLLREVALERSTGGE